MSFTFNEWDVRDQIATPKFHRVPFLSGSENIDQEYFDFSQWAKTQSIPARGVGDGTYSIADIEIVLQQRLPNPNAAWCNCAKVDGIYIRITDWETRQIIRLKPQSHLISGDREMQVDIEGEEKERHLDNYKVIADELTRQNKSLIEALEWIANHCDQNDNLEINRTLIVKKAESALNES